MRRFGPVFFTKEVVFLLAVSSMQLDAKPNNCRYGPPELTRASQKNRYVYTSQTWGMDMQTSSAERIKDYNSKGWWDNETLSEIFQDALDASYDRLALIDPPNRESLVAGPIKRLTFSEVDQAADRIASWMHSGGLRQGDIALVQMPNTVEIVLMYLAAARLGIILSPIAVQYGQFEIDHIQSVIKPKAYLAFRQFRGEVFGSSLAEALAEDCRILLWGDEDFNIDTAPEPSAAYLSYAAGLKQSPNDVFTICWTSGTTGRSKGVPRSHNQWLASALACEDSVNLPEGSIYLNPFPFINMAAIGGFLYFWLKNRGTMVLHHPFDGPVFLSQLQNEKAVYTIAPPALLNQIIATKDQVKAGFDLSNLKLIGSGSAPLSPHMIKGFKEEFDIDVVNVFGSNEGSALLSGPRDVADPEERALYFPRFGRDEHAWPNRIADRLRTKLINLDTGAEITTAGKPGELCLSGATVFDGYFNSPDDNAKAFTEDGYFRSGDLFQIAGDKDQYYQFVGRCKALIIRGGVNISPEELDEVLLTHPDIADAAVASYPDKIMGEKICAFIVPAPGKNISLDNVTAYFKAKNIAKFKWPERIEIVQALPRNPMNKVVRSDLSALLG